MANTLGTLVVRLGLDAADFIQGMSKADLEANRFAEKQKRAAAAVDRTVQALERQAILAGKSSREAQLLQLAWRGATEEQLKAADAALKQVESQQKWASHAAAAGLAAGALAAGFVAMVRAQVDAVDKFNDLADATGASIENISGLDEIARRTGTAVDTVGAALTKFNATLKEANSENEAGDVFKRLGLNLAELKKLDPAEAMLKTAQALDKFALDGNRARDTQTLFGKSVREVAPLLKDMAEQGQLVASVTSQQAAEAEKFNREIFKLQATVQNVGRAFALDLVTGINEAAKALRQSGLLEGFRTLFTGSDQYKNDKRLVELTDQLMQAQNALDASRGRDRRFGDKSLDTAANERRVAALQAEINTTMAMRRMLQGESAAAAAAARSTGGGKGDGKSTRWSGLTYDEQVSQNVGKLIEDSDVIKAKVFADTLARLDDMFFKGLISANLYDSALQKLTRSVTSAGAALPELSDEAKHIGDVFEEEQKAIREWTKQMERRDAETIQQLFAFSGRTDADRKRRQADALAEFLKKNPDSFTKEETEKIVKGIAGISDEAKKVTSIAEDLGLTFSSAFEQAALGGKKLSDVLKGLGRDIAAIVIRKTVTEKVAGAITDAIKGGSGDGGVGNLLSSLGNLIFGGGRAGGGDVMPGRAYVVGEHRPELFVPKVAGTIVPRVPGGGGSDGPPIYINVTTTDVVSRQELRSTVRQAVSGVVGARRRLVTYGGDE